MDMRRKLNFNFEEEERQIQNLQIKYMPEITERNAQGFLDDLAKLSEITRLFIFNGMQTANEEAKRSLAFLRTFLKAHPNREIEEQVNLVFDHDYLFQSDFKQLNLSQKFQFLFLLSGSEEPATILFNQEFVTEKAHLTIFAALTDEFAEVFQFHPGRTKIACSVNFMDLPSQQQLVFLNLLVQASIEDLDKILETQASYYQPSNVPRILDAVLQSNQPKLQILVNKLLEYQEPKVVPPAAAPVPAAAQENISRPRP